MAIIGKLYYAEKKEKPPLFKQIVKPLSEPRKMDGVDQSILKAERAIIDYRGFNYDPDGEFVDFPDEGKESEGRGDITIKPIEEVDSEELRDFFISIFEDEPYRPKEA